MNNSLIFCSCRLGKRGRHLRKTNIDQRLTSRQHVYFKVCTDDID